MNRYIIDSSAWIEYFTGSAKGAKVRALLSKAQLFTTGVIAAEISIHFIRKGLSAGDAITAMKSQARIFEFDYTLGERTAETYVKRRKTHPKFGLADAHVLAAARLHKAKVITCDHDFSGLPETILIK